MRTGIFTITSPIHDPARIESDSRRLMDPVLAAFGDVVFHGGDFTDYPSCDCPFIFIRTGGTEGKFRELYPHLKGPYYLLASDTGNSLAASMEILSYLRSHGERAEIIHGSHPEVIKRMGDIIKIWQALTNLDGSRYAVIGAPSDWLISSAADYGAVRRRLGMELIDIPMRELLDEIGKEGYPEIESKYRAARFDSEVMEGALNIYGALCRLVDKYSLSGFTLRCFDLLGAVRNTGCLALAVFNSEGRVAACEGDVPALLSMAIMKALTGSPGFQANPSFVDMSANEVIFAHCTVPFSMVRSYEFDSHYESGLGVAVRGKLPEGAATIFKVSGDLGRHFVSDAEITGNLRRETLCRTQITVRPEESVKYFLTESIGNHHIIATGSHKGLIDAFFAELGG